MKKFLLIFVIFLTSCSSPSDQKINTKSLFSYLKYDFSTDSYVPSTEILITFSSYSFFINKNGCALAEFKSDKILIPQNLGEVSSIYGIIERDNDCFLNDVFFKIKKEDPNYSLEILGEYYKVKYQ